MSDAVTQDREDAADARKARAEAQPSLDPARPVFLDGTWATTNMARRYGRAPRGQRALDAVPHRRWRTTTFVGALRAEGIVAPLFLEGAVNGRAFLAYVERIPALALRPGGVPVMDNLSGHKVAGARESVGAAGATLLYLPPYRPRPRPDRDGVRQAQGHVALRGRPHGRGPVDRRWPPAHPLPARRVRTLPRPPRPRAVGVNRL